MKEIEITLSPEENATPELLLEIVSKKLKTSPDEIRECIVLRRSLDARKQPRFHLRCKVLFKNDPSETDQSETLFKPVDLKNRPPVIVVGTGPAGLFAALRLAEHGLKPILIERGKAVRERRFDLAALMKRGDLNPESNYCFGEGGAGTFSDGKLYTRSLKRGRVSSVLDTFIHFGASSAIGVDAHPHIGTNKLPQIITAMRSYLEECGAEFHFSTKLESFITSDNTILGVNTSKGQIEGKAILLATGHSARDVYTYLDKIGLELQAKGFAVGVRIEHPQEIINRIQYGAHWKSELLPPASYQLVAQSDERGVYSFCMCPGGVICPASTNPERLVVNGWSPSRRNSPFANSGMVVEIPVETYMKGSSSSLAGIKYQDAIEHSAYNAGGGKYKAPGQRLLDYISNKTSNNLPETSYKPGTCSADLREILPPEISNRLNEGLKQFIKSKPLYGSSESVLIGVESRTSSPIRIPRDEHGMHPQMKGLFPCGEGAGFAGGIVSAALDGQKIADSIRSYLS